MPEISLDVKYLSNAKFLVVKMCYRFPAALLDKGVPLASAVPKTKFGGFSCLSMIEVLL